MTFQHILRGEMPMSYIKHEKISNSKKLPFKVFNFHAHNLNRVIPMHWHQSTELLYCAQGKLEVKLKNHNFLLCKNDFIAINPYQIHSTKSLQKNSVLCIQLPLPFLNELTNNTFLYKYIFAANSCTESNSINQELISTFKDIINLQNSDSSLVTNLKITTNVINVVRILTEFYAKESNIDQQESNIYFVEELTSFISQNFDKDIQIHDVSQHFAYSEGYTSRLIKKSLGTSFSELLRLVRINKAIDLMNSSPKSWVEIAELTGFKTYRNLYNAFYSVYQMSPNEFKNQNQ